MSWHWTEPVSVNWEYQYLPQSQDRLDNLRALNEAGAAGWELCHVGHLHYLVKRSVFRQQGVAQSGQLPA